MTSFDKVVVTGGAGLIGSHIVDLLVDGQREGTYGEIVVSTTSRAGGATTSPARSSSGASTSSRATSATVSCWPSRCEGIDLVFHLAAIRITHCAEDPRLALDVLGNGTFNVARGRGAGRRREDRRIVLGLGVRTGRRLPHHRASIIRTTTARSTARSRRSTRACFARFNDMYGLDYVALRYFNVYGPRMDIYGAYTEVLIRWMERILGGEPPLIFGDGKQTMDFVYVTDIARANILAAQSPISDDVFNIASGTETSLNELAEALMQGDGRRPAARVRAGAQRQPGAASAGRHEPRARELLGFEAQVDLEHGPEHWSTGGQRRRRAGGRGHRMTMPARSIPLAKPGDGRGGSRRRHAVILSGWITQGPEVAAFERGVRHLRRRAPRLRRVELHHRPASRPARPRRRRRATKSSPSATRTSRLRTPSATAGRPRCSSTSTRHPQHRPCR